MVRKTENLGSSNSPATVTRVYECSAAEPASGTSFRRRRDRTMNTVLCLQSGLHYVRNGTSILSRAKLRLNGAPISISGTGHGLFEMDTPFPSMHVHT